MSFNSTLTCPNCGMCDVDAQPFKKGTARGYDCYCPECEWSGDILPDHESRYYESIDSDTLRTNDTPKQRKNGEKDV